MKEVTWIEGYPLGCPYDYPEGFPKLHLLGSTLWHDLNNEREGIGDMEKIPRELRRRRWIPAVTTFHGEKGSIDIRVCDGDNMPMRTVKFLVRNDKTLKGIKRRQY